ncbi:MAG: hypothetical protein J2P50_18100 [Hyphomicrobiaceae bacterium]|nr:hypothetical protein [Hyphomicrobiaceae bacterium]
MPMTQIAKGAGPITRVNVVSVQPEQQDRRVRPLNAVARRRCGTFRFGLASMRKGLDGRRVVDDARWRSKKDFEARAKNPQAAAHI